MNQRPNGPTVHLTRDYQYTNDQPVGPCDIDDTETRADGWPDETPNNFDSNLLRTDDPTQCSKYSKAKRKSDGTLIDAYQDMSDKSRNRATSSGGQTWLPSTQGGRRASFVRERSMGITDQSDDGSSTEPAI